MYRFAHRNLKFTFWLFCLFTMIALLGCGGQDPDLGSAAAVAAFVNVNVIPMDSERIFENQTVIVQDDLIVQMGPASDVQIPKQALKIEGKGKYLMPGLADMHFHNENENDFVLCLANGITTIRNMWGDTKHLEWRRRIENGELLGPALITAGPLLDGPPPIWEGSVVIETVVQAKQAVIEQTKAGYDFIKIYDKLSLEVFDAIMEEAGKQDIPVAGHIPFAVGVQRALDSGLASNEHLTGYMDMIQADDFPGKGKDDPVSRLRSWMYLDERKIPQVLALTQNSSLWDCVTLVVYQGLMSPSEAYEFLKRPELKYLGPLTGAFWDPKNDPRWEELNEEDFAHRQEMDKILKKLTGALHREGGHILLGTDCQNGMTIPGFSIHRELQNLVEAGLTPYEAIKAGTADAAAFLEVDTFGTIAPGKRADIILVEGNPLEDVSNVKHIDGVMVRGIWLPQEKLQHMLDDLAASFIPPENRFAEVPPLSPKEDVILSARFEMHYADVPMGEERFVVEKLPDRKKRIQAQAITDAPYGSFAAMDMIIDDSGGCLSLGYSHETSTGKKWIEMVRSGENLRISGDLGTEEPLDMEESVPEVFYLGASLLSNILPVLEIAKPLRIGENIEFKGKAIRVLPFWFISFIVDETINLKRTENTEMRTAQGNIPVSVFEMEVSSKSFPHKAKIFMNDDGELHEVHLSNQQAVFKFVRKD